jgi:hypothetical protein
MKFGWFGYINFKSLFFFSIKIESDSSSQSKLAYHSRSIFLSKLANNLAFLSSPYLNIYCSKTEASSGSSMVGTWTCLCVQGT